MCIVLGIKKMDNILTTMKWSLFVGSLYFFLVALAHMFELKIPVLFIYFDITSFAYQNKIISFLCFGWSVFLYTAFLDPAKNLILIKAILIAGTGAILGLSMINLTMDFQALSTDVNVYSYWFVTALLGLYLFWLIMLYLKIRKR